MKHFSFELIENKLDIKLPEFYKNIIQNYPFEDIYKFRHVFDSIYNEDKKIIEININLRQKGYQNKNWPLNFFVFGENGKDNYYFLDLKKAKEEIFFIKNDKKFNPKKVENNLLEDSFERFIKAQKNLQEILDNP